MLQATLIHCVQILFYSFEEPMNQIRALTELTKLHHPNLGYRKCIILRLIMLIELSLLFRLSSITMKKKNVSLFNVTHCN